MLPPDESFLAALQAADVDGAPALREKEILLATLRFYFGPANAWGAVLNVSDPASLVQLNEILRQPGERYDVLEQQTSLPAGYFNSDQPATSEVKLYAAKKEHPEAMSCLRVSYFVYEARANVTLYVGPDFFHHEEGRIVVNTLVLDAQHRPVESHTLRFGDVCSLPG